MTKREATRAEYVEAMEGMESSFIDEAALEALRKNAPIGLPSRVVVVDLRGLSPELSYAGAVGVPMQDLVAPVMKKIAPEKDTTLVLICNQSFELTRMVALSSYAYPTLKLMGYADVKILKTYQGLGASF